MEPVAPVQRSPRFAVPGPPPGVAAWLRQLVVDAQSRDQGALAGDVATLEWIRDRTETALDPVEVTRLDTLLKELRANAGDEDFDAASETASKLKEIIS